MMHHLNQNQSNHSMSFTKKDRYMSPSRPKTRDKMKSLKLGGENEPYLHKRVLTQNTFNSYRDNKRVSSKFDQGKRSSSSFRLNSHQQVNKSELLNSKLNLINHYSDKNSAMHFNKYQNENLEQFNIQSRNIDAQNKQALFLLSQYQPENALKHLRIVEEILKRKEVKQYHNSAVLKQQILTYSSLAECHNQLKDVSLSLVYLKKTLEAAQGLHMIQQEDMDLWSDPENITVFNWSDRAIAETMVNMTMAILSLQDYKEALIYSNQACQWTKRCLDMLQEVLQSNAKRLFDEEDDSKFLNYGQNYYKMVEYQAKSLINTGQILKCLKNFKDAETKLYEAKCTLHANLQCFIYIAKPLEQDVDIKKYDRYFKFVKRYLINIRPDNLMECNYLLKNTEKLVRHNDLKTQYSQSQLASKKQEISTRLMKLRNFKQPSYIQRDIERVVSKLGNSPVVAKQRTFSSLNPLHKQGFEDEVNFFQESARDQIQSTEGTMITSKNTENNLKMNQSMPHFFNPTQTHFEQRQADFQKIQKTGINVDKLNSVYKSSQYSNVAISYRDITEESKDLYGGNEQYISEEKPKTSESFNSRRQRYTKNYNSLNTRQMAKSNLNTRQNIVQHPKKSPIPINISIKQQTKSNLSMKRSNDMSIQFGNLNVLRDSKGNADISSFRNPARKVIKRNKRSLIEDKDPYKNIQGQEKHERNQSQESLDSLHFYGDGIDQSPQKKSNSRLSQQNSRSSSNQQKKWVDLKKVKVDFSSKINVICLEPQARINEISRLSERPAKSHRTISRQKSRGTSRAASRLTSQQDSNQQKSVNDKLASISYQQRSTTDNKYITVSRPQSVAKSRQTSSLKSRPQPVLKSRPQSQIKSVNTSKAPEVKIHQKMLENKNKTQRQWTETLINLQKMEYILTLYYLEGSDVHNLENFDRIQKMVIKSQQEMSGEYADLIKISKEIQNQLVEVEVALNQSFDEKQLSKNRDSFQELEQLKGFFKSQSQIFDGLDLILCQVTISDDKNFILSLIEQISNKYDELKYKIQKLKDLEQHILGLAKSADNIQEFLNQKTLQIHQKSRESHESSDSKMQKKIQQLKQKYYQDTNFGHSIDSSTAEDVIIGVKANSWDKKLLVADVSGDLHNSKGLQIFVKFLTKFDEEFQTNFLFVKVYFEIFCVNTMLRLDEECMSEEIRINALEQSKFQNLSENFESLVKSKNLKFEDHPFTSNLTIVKQLLRQALVGPQPSQSVKDENQTDYTLQKLMQISDYGIAPRVNPEFVPFQPLNSTVKTENTKHMEESPIHIHELSKIQASDEYVDNRSKSVLPQSIQELLKPQDKNSSIANDPHIKQMVMDKVPDGSINSLMQTKSQYMDKPFDENYEEQESEVLIQDESKGNFLAKKTEDPSLQGIIWDRAKKQKPQEYEENKEGESKEISRTFQQSNVQVNDSINIFKDSNIRVDSSSVNDPSIKKSRVKPRSSQVSVRDDSQGKQQQSQAQSKISQKSNRKEPVTVQQSSVVQSSSGWFSQHSQSGSASLNEEARFNKGFEKYVRQKDEIEKQEEEKQARATDKAILERFKSFHIDKAIQKGMIKNGMFSKEVSPKNENIGVQSPKIIDDIKLNIKLNDLQYKEQDKLIKKFNANSPTAEEIQKKFKGDKDLVYNDLAAYPDKSLYRGWMKVQEARIPGSINILELTTRQGFGFRQLEDGSKYEGHWEDNKPNGQGIFTYTNGDVYKGSFKNGFLDGKGEFKYHYNSQIYRGSFKSNKRHGNGVLIFEDGSVFIGQFQNDKRNGKGKIVDTEGVEKQGIWKNDKQVKNS